MSIVEVIGKYIKLEKQNKNMWGICPFCHDLAKTLKVSPAEEQFFCYTCGTGGNAHHFLMKKLNVSFNEADIIINGTNAAMDSIYSTDTNQQIIQINKDAGNYFFKRFQEKDAYNARNYAAKRKLSQETIKKFIIGYSDDKPDSLYRYLRKKGHDSEIILRSGLCDFDEKRGFHDKFWNRLMFPILNEHGEPVGFGGRILGDGTPKYINSPETTVFHKRQTLYGLNFAKHTSKSYFLMCEGYLDVISMHQSGIDNAIATLGTAVTNSHAQLIRKYKSAVYLCYDSDDAGINAAIKAIPILYENNLACKVINLAPYKDPDELIKALGRNEFEERIKCATNGLEFLFVHLSGENQEKGNNENKFDFTKKEELLLFLSKYYS